MVVALVVGLALAVIVAYCLVWTRYRCRAALAEPVEATWGLDDVQVRIVTVGDAPETVRETVETLPAGFGIPVVVSETPIEIPGAAVRVVPETYAPARATDKARAMEWARTNLGGDEEYVLYLDEDTHVADFEGLPDADIVQLRRRPGSTDSALVQLMEMHRAGILRKELGFGPIPFHAWGGGLAIRRSVEDAVTWDRVTVSEDTAFVWAATAAGYTHEVLDVACDNQAPPSVRSAIVQRRRWACMLWETDRLPPLARTSVVFQLAAWWLFPFTLPLVAAAAVVGGPVAMLGTVVIAYNLLWSYDGWRLYDASPWSLAVLICGGFFVTNVVNFAGRLWGMLSPPSEFQVTVKR